MPHHVSILTAQPTLGTAGWNRCAPLPTQASGDPGRPVPLSLDEMPRWAELITRALHYLPPALPQENPAIVRGVLQLLHEHTPSPWALTIAEGNPFQFPETCREIRHHLYQEESGGWHWVTKSSRSHTAESTLSMLLEPATVADHARLLRMPARGNGPVSVYRWGGEGFIAILNLAGLTMAIRDMPGLSEANDILVTREGISGEAFDQLEMDTIVKLFAREEDQPMSPDRDEILIDDETDGLSGVPSAFMSLTRCGITEGVLPQISRKMRMAGPGREAQAWQQLSDADQHRFNIERVRHLLIPSVLEPSPSNAPGAEAADVLLLLGLVQRFEDTAKPRDELANRSLLEVAIHEASRHLQQGRAKSADLEAVDKRLTLLAQVWAYYGGVVPNWAPKACHQQLEHELNMFMTRLSRRAERVVTPA